MNIDLIFPSLPPTLDGIGDHTAHLARALSERHCTVRIHTAQKTWDSIPGVTIERTFDLNRRRGILNLLEPVRSRPPQWLLVQFEQFSYGNRGFNPFLPLVLYRIRSAVPTLRLAVMFHEDFMPAEGIRSSLMSTWQRVQFWLLGRLADAALFATEPRAAKYESWFPDTQVSHLPVGSNIPYLKTNREQARQRLDIDADAFVIGLFGSAHPSKLLSHINAAARACTSVLPDCRLLYIGPDGDRVRNKLDAAVPLIDTGPLPADEVSRCFAAMDVYLAPFAKGVSTRRGSFLVGLQHGVATVTTRGRATGNLLTQKHTQAFLAPTADRKELFIDNVRTLAQSPEKRRRLAHNGQSLYNEHFSWDTIAGKLHTALDRSRTPADAASDPAHAL